MWFWLSLIALLCWSGSDLFSKIGCREANDKTAHLKMVMAVGIVMGLHACFEIFVNGVEADSMMELLLLGVKKGERVIVSSPARGSEESVKRIAAAIAGGLARA